MKRFVCPECGSAVHSIGRVDCDTPIPCAECFWTAGRSVSMTLASDDVVNVWAQFEHAEMGGEG